jgi:catechol 2,3-dioxygenase-like lactoylglutathione lyase family enzyme
MINSIHHVGIFTNNPLNLIEFYTEKIGFETESTKMVPENLMKEIFSISTECKLTKLKYGLIILEIISSENIEFRQKNDDVSGLNHWSLGVKDKDGFCRELTNKGVDIIRIENKGRFICFVKDPDGNLIEIYEMREGIQNA